MKRFQLYLPRSVPETEVDDGPVFALPDTSPAPAENIIYADYKVDIIRP